MHRIPLRWLLPAVIAMAMAASTAWAQGRPAAAVAADPLDAHAVVPPVVYRSTLSQYRRLGDDAPVPWRTANDTVDRIGGWRAYAREASAAQEAPGTSPTAPPASAPGQATPPAHGGHVMH
ncbi:MAG: hypothetical protein OEU93_11375 [Rubrivivax sp.]|nr:hypothetical protein [Rubrivivax sp.]